jgi:hypothetical protein
VVTTCPPVIDIDERLWLVFFRDGGVQRWWNALLRPGFRHVSAAAWFDREQRWVFVDPAYSQTVIRVVEDGPAATALLGHWTQESAAVLRVRSGAARSFVPPVMGCVGQVKALLGVRCRALSPFGFHRHLLAQGAEIVEVPQPEMPDGDVQFEHAGRAAGGPAGRGAA